MCVNVVIILLKKFPFSISPSSSLSFQTFSYLPLSLRKRVLAYYAVFVFSTVSQKMPQISDIQATTTPFVYRR